ncbi:MAG: MMPL family transporter [Acidimicrobiia bacterium]|nr:MMPL family transporter [Acidimicrobiia bacterium]
MKQFIRLLAALVRRAPVAVIVTALMITGGLAVASSQQQRAAGNEGFSPDSAEFRAYETIDAVFAESSEVAVQVVFAAPSGDVLDAAGLRAYAAAVAAAAESRAGELFVGRPGGDVAGFFGPTLAVLAAEGITPETATNDQVKQAFAAARKELPPEVDAQLLGLLSSRADPAVPASPAGLMVVFLNLSPLGDDPDGSRLQAIEVDLAAALREVSSEAVTVQPFSFGLLFEDTAEVQGEIGRLFGTAFLIILLILAFVFWVHPRGRLTRWGAVRRAGADVLLAMAVIGMSIVWMNGIGVLLGPGYLGVIGKFNEILQVIPILLVGLGVDYAIHLAARYREELGEGADVVGAATRATRTVGVALVLATVTTAVGFLTNLFSPIGSVADFGVLATVGIGAAFLLMLTFVPSVRLLLDRRAERAGRLPAEALGRTSGRSLPRLMGSTSVLAERMPALVLVVALAAGGLGFWGLTRLDTTFSFTDFIPQDSPLLATFQTITEEFGGGFGERTQVLVQGEVTDPKAHNALVAAQAAMAGTPGVQVYGGAAAAESPVTVLWRLTTSPEAGGDSDTYDAEFTAAATRLGLQADLTVSSGTDVAALYDAALQAAPEEMGRVAAREGESYRYLNVVVSTEAGEAGAMALRDGLYEDFALLNSVSGVDAVPTSDNIVAGGVVESLRASQVSSLGLTIAAAMALLVITFLMESRRPLLGVITIAPVALVVLWVFGMMAVTGISFNPVTGMIASIAIGIGVPYTIHITHRYQEDRLRCSTPEEAIRSTMTHTGGALAGSALTTVAGFGILVTSSLKPFQQFGAVIAYAIGFALVAAVVVLPSMLVLWDRWHRRRGGPVFDEDALEEALPVG